MSDLRAQWEDCKVCGGDHWTKDHEQQAAPEPALDILDRLMELWQKPWSEPAYGEAQMLLGRLRAAVDQLTDEDICQHDGIESAADCPKATR